ncbi:MAG: anhydro-N-acetylmuramic acid kinase [Proteobacteria bacterium]|nr:anhydro-N-acetylmuramic acid kinase [Pseudomonadota bacterium]
MTETRGAVLRAIGLMSGTSLDGVDIALIETDGERVLSFGPTGYRAYSEDERALLRQALAEGAGLTDRTSRPGVLAEAEAFVTRAHVETIQQFLAAERIDRASVDIVGFHGQTVLHKPAARLTVQIGRGDTVARQVGIPVAYDFRQADIMAGGQGAPLVPVFHAALARDLPKPLAVVNIGGVGNVTWIGADGALLAFDTGPGNGPIDDWCARRAGMRFDRDGLLAASGHVDGTRLTRFAEHRYFAKLPPKSLDRGDFSDGWAEGLSVADGAATLTRGTARAIALAARHFPAPAAQWVICGGGARNPTLLKAIAEETRGTVVTADSLGWNGDALEAQAFGFLAVRSLRGLPISFPGTTGAPRPLTGGKVDLP